MLASTKPQQRKKEESETLRGERDQIEFIYLKIQRSKKARRSINYKFVG